MLWSPSMNAYHSKGKVEEKRRRLVERREKLRRLLEGEKEAMEVCTLYTLSSLAYYWDCTSVSIYGLRMKMLLIGGIDGCTLWNWGFHMNTKLYLLAWDQILHTMTIFEECYAYMHVLCVCPTCFRESWKRSHVTSSPTWRKGIYVHVEL